jgi:hypothetical protein
VDTVKVILSYLTSIIVEYKAGNMFLISKMLPDPRNCSGKLKTVEQFSTVSINVLGCFPTVSGN